MQKKSIVLLLSIAFLASAASVYAEPGKQDVIKERDVRKPERMQEQMTTKELSAEGEKQMKVIQTMEASQMNRLEGNRGGIREAREEFKQEMRIMKLEMKNDAGTRSAELRAKMEAEKAAFKQKLATLTDDRKASMAAKIDTKLVSINENRTAKMTNALSKLQEILNRLIDRANAAKTAGMDTTAVEAAIVKAKASLTAAETAVTAQKAKTYTAVISGDATLPQNFGSVFKQLQTDLQTAYTAFKTAKTDVKQVASELRKLQPGAIPTAGTATSAPTASPTATLTVTPTP